jgi:hypothetical protein
MSNLTLLLDCITQDSYTSAQSLFLDYNEFCHLAARRLAHEVTDQIPEPTRQKTLASTCLPIPHDLWEENSHALIAFPIVCTGNHQRSHYLRFAGK